MMSPQSADARSVSVVVTTYNHAHFLAEALDSVLNQSLAPAEVIVVDDGSTDDPAAVIRHYPDVRLIRQANQGLAAARNAGLRAAGGTYVVFLDADDRLLRDAIKNNLELYAANPRAGFVYGAYGFIDRSGNPRGDGYFRSVGPEPYITFLEGNCIGMHATVMYRRDLLLQVSGFDITLKACEDYDVYLRMALLFPVACAPLRIAEYRKHGSNMSDESSRMLEAAVTVLRKQDGAVRENPEWANAYRAGLAGWKELYARQHLKHVAAALKKRKAFARVIWETIRISRHAGLALPRVALGTVARRLRKRWRSRQDAALSLGDLRRTIPVCERFGYSRGKPVDRRYIEAFLASRAQDIRGRVLEIGDDSYTREFGGGKVTKRDVLNRFPGHPQTTFIGDLSGSNDLPSDCFDCIILTQTLHLIYEVREALRTLHRILRPGGVLLVTVPWVSSIDRGEWGRSWYWSFSPLALKRLLEDQFGEAHATVVEFGNVLAATAFLYGLAEHELTTEEMDRHDPYCPVIVAGRAVKAT